jgi:hypothetical protein
MGDAATRLREIAAELRNEGLSNEDAERLAREAADLLGSASAELERALREAGGGES